LDKARFASTEAVSGNIDRAIFFSACMVMVSSLIKQRRSHLTATAARFIGGFLILFTTPIKTYSSSLGLGGCGPSRHAARCLATPGLA